MMLGRSTLRALTARNGPAASSSGEIQDAVTEAINVIGFLFKPACNQRIMQLCPFLRFRLIKSFLNEQANVYQGTPFLILAVNDVLVTILRELGQQLEV
mmetsp:Transcript_12707/g.35134  ORF Transcript_12707/g.35134 Transcript_12707/m.35134 type:complete len:99 (+) Transcript_12707:2042-2338(+)